MIETVINLNTGPTKNSIQITKTCYGLLIYWEVEVLGKGKLV